MFIMDALFEESKTQMMLGQNMKAEELYTDFINSCNAEVTSGREVADSLRVQLAEAYNNRGQIKYLRVDFTKAIEDYSTAINVNGNFATAYYNRGQIHYRLARFQEGINDFQLALKHRPDFPDAAIALKTAQDDKRRSEHQTRHNITP